MAAIKKFFEKRKMDIKFKKAGGGHRLTEDTRSAPGGSSQRPSAGGSRAGPSSEAQRAAQAALVRLDGPRKGGSSGMSAMRTQVCSELEAERQAATRAMAAAQLYSAPSEVYHDHAPVLAVTGVYYKCPMAGPAALPRKDMEQYIEEFLLSQLAEEPEMTTALMIHTLNKEAEKVKVCIDTLCKYVDNVISNPTEEKFRKIRMNNKAFQERVAGLRGTEEFLQAAGFDHRILPGPSGIDENFLVLNDVAAADMDRLCTLKDVLVAAEPIRPELDRNVMVFHPSANASHIQVPHEFYNVTPEELKKEQQVKAEAVEKLGMLRTKEMRERERLRELRRYRYCLLRVRLPDGLLLQGTFRANEKLSALVNFVRENLENDWIPFTLNSSTGHKFTEESVSLAELELAPAAVLALEYDQNILKEMAAQQGSASIRQHLKAELMQGIKAL